MNIVTEDFVSFEIAKLLKEKGFDESTSMVYTSYGHLCKLNRYDNIRNSNYNDITKNYFEYTAPTIQMAMEWLREVHHKYCDIGYDIDLKWFIQIIDLTESAEHNYPENGSGFKSYEQACEIAIKYCLEKLI